jgi:hypothetical protein
MATPSDMQPDPQGANSLEFLAHGTPTDLRTLQFKITYVGPQSKPVPTIVFTSFYHLIQMDKFLPLRRPGLHYGNDDVLVWNFTVTPEEMQQIALSLNGLQALHDFQAMNESFISLVAVLKDSRLGECAFEAILDRQNAQQVMSAIRSGMNADNGLAHTILDLHWSMVFT